MRDVPVSFTLVVGAWTCGSLTVGTPAEPSDGVSDGEVGTTTPYWALVCCSCHWRRFVGRGASIGGRFTTNEHRCVGNDRCFAIDERCVSTDFNHLATNSQLLPTNT